jgi:hypothetical protein
MTEDAEINAMSEISSALSKLEQDAIRRVLKWAADKFQLTNMEHGKAIGDTEVEERGGKEFEDFASVYDVANPENSLERALVAGYWFQVAQGQNDFDGQTVNSELKHMGHPVANITRTFDRLMQEKPRLAMQVRKSGKSKQARKRYKLTTEGIRNVERMLAGGIRTTEDE